MKCAKKIFAGKQYIKDNKIPAKEKSQIEILYAEFEQIIIEIFNLKNQTQANRLFMLENRKEQLKLK